MKKVLSIVVLALMAFALAGCVGESERSDSASTNQHFYKVDDSVVGMYDIVTIQDKETGCQYVLGMGSGTSITERKDASGKQVCVAP